MRIAIRQAALRWIVALYVVGFVVEVLLIVGHAPARGPGRGHRAAVPRARLPAVAGGAAAKAAVERWDVPARRLNCPLPGEEVAVHIPFSSSPRSSLGVEWELELVDLETRHLRSGASDILAELTGRTERGGG